MLAVPGGVEGPFAAAAEAHAAGGGGFLAEGVFWASHSSSVIEDVSSVLVTGSPWVTGLGSAVSWSAPCPYQAPPTVFPPCFFFSCSRSALVASFASRKRGFSFLPQGQVQPTRPVRLSGLNRAARATLTRLAFALVGLAGQGLDPLNAPVFLSLVKICPLPWQVGQPSWVMRRIAASLRVMTVVLWASIWEAAIKAMRMPRRAWSGTVLGTLRPLPMRARGTGFRRRAAWLSGWGWWSSRA